MTLLSQAREKHDATRDNRAIRTDQKRKEEQFILSSSVREKIRKVRFPDHIASFRCHPQILREEIGPVKQPRQTNRSQFSFYSDLCTIELIHSTPRPAPT
jgi:hypothetical protein